MGFEPEHFLDESGNYITDKEGFIPFGIGIRGCPAADLVNMQMFLIITNLLKTFSFRVPPGDGGHIGTYYEAGFVVCTNMSTIARWYTEGKCFQKICNDQKHLHVNKISSWASPNTYAKRNKSFLVTNAH